jgi:hypothetical protein
MSQDVVPDALVDPLPPEAWVFGEDAGRDPDSGDGTPGQPRRSAARDAGWGLSLTVGLVAFGLTAGVIGLILLVGPAMAFALPMGCGGG